MAVTIHREKLEQLLKELFAELSKENGPLAGVQNKEQIIDNVINNLLQNDGVELSLKNVHDNPHVKLALGLALVSEAVASKNPEHKLDYTKLFTKDLNKTELDELKNELKQLLQELELRLQQINPKFKLEPKSVNKLIDNLTEHLAKDNEKSIAAENQEVMSVMFTLMNELVLALKNLYGGIDPRVAGGERSAVLENIGNYAGIVDYNGEANEVSVAFLDVLNSFFQPTADPSNRNAIANRLEAITTTMEDALKDILYVSPTLKPPGTT